MDRQPKRILAVKTHALGDALMTTPALRAIGKSFPDAKIDYLVGKWSSAALTGNRWIDSVIVIDDAVFHKRQIGQLWSLIKTIRSGKYDLAVIFQPSPLVHLLIRLGGVQNIAAPVNRRVSMGVTHPSKWRVDRDRYVVEDFSDVVRGLGIDIHDQNLEFDVSRSAFDKAEEIHLNNHLKAGEYLLLFPGGGRNPRDFVPQKLWPVEFYRDLVKRALESGIPVVLAGGTTDRERASRLLVSSEVRNLVGETSLDVAAALIKSAAVTVSNDSVPIHLSLAVDSPFVGIFGPSRRNALLPKNGNFIAVEADFPCAPCYDNEPFKSCDRFNCIESVSVDKVWKAVRELLKK